MLKEGGKEKVESTYLTRLVVVNWESLDFQLKLFELFSFALNTNAEPFNPLLFWCNNELIESHLKTEVVLRSTNTMQPFMTGNSSSNLASVSGQVSRDNHVPRENVFDWNLDNFQIDLTHGLGTGDSFLSGVNRTSTTDPWSSFLPTRATESVNLGSVNLSRNSMADSSGAAALNNQVL